jgi:hypothetical protein
VAPPCIRSQEHKVPVPDYTLAIKQRFSIIPAGATPQTFCMVTYGHRKVSETGRAGKFPRRAGQGPLFGATSPPGRVLVKGRSPPD